MCCVSSDLGKRYGIKCGAIGCTIGNLSGNMVGIVPKSKKKKLNPNAVCLLLPKGKKMNPLGCMLGHFIWLHAREFYS